MTKLIINGAPYDVPEDDDYTLGEIAEARKLNDDLGDLGDTIALLWVVKHREDPSFTIDDAKQLKIRDYDVEETPEVPLDGSGGSNENGSSSKPRSATRGGSGPRRSAKSTA